MLASLTPGLFTCDVGEEYDPEHPWFSCHMTMLPPIGGEIDFLDDHGERHHLVVTRVVVTILRVEPLLLPDGPRPLAIQQSIFLVVLRQETLLGQ